MNILRTDDSARFRPVLGGLVPALVTVVLLPVGFAAQGAIVAPIQAWSPVASLPASILTNAALYVALILLALWVATKLDGRSYTEYGLSVDRTWIRNVVAGFFLSVVCVVASVWYADVRSLVDVSLTVDAATPEGILALVGGLALLGSFLAFSTVYEEVVYRGIMLQNFAEGLTGRGISPSWAVVVATVASLLVFGAFHLVLRGPFVALDSALVGVTFALAYLLTGNLGLAIGVHLGRLPMGLLVQGEEMGIGLATMTIPTEIAPYLELTLLQVGLVTAGALLWVYLVDGEIGIAERVYTPTTDSSG